MTMKFNNIPIIKDNCIVATGKFTYQDGCLNLKINDSIEYNACASNAFDALVRLRELMYPLQPKCKGAAIDVYTSEMSRQMGNGLQAYQLTLGAQTRRNDLVSIFDQAEIEKITTPDKQKQYYFYWLDSLVYFDCNNFFNKIDEHLLDKFMGTLFGLACGDALGTTVEFMSPGTFNPVETIIGGGPFNLKAGQWTDDTSMALCLADSLIKKKSFDVKDQMDRYVKWYKNGYLSSTGYCFDIGNTVRQALDRYIVSGNPLSGTNNKYSAGNGALMRVAPVALFFMKTPIEGVEKAGESSKTTHGASESIDACRFFAHLIINALRGKSKIELLSPLFVMDGYSLISDSNKINELINGSYKRKSPPDIKGTGYVVESLEAALWAFHKSNNFKEGCLLAANLGNDADTTCAIYGQIAGAYYGYSCIPNEWVNAIFYHNLIKSYSMALYRLSVSR